MKKYYNPIANDPYAILWEAFKILYPDCRVDDVVFDTLDEGYGLTNFAYDGTVSIFIDPKISVIDSIEIFAHELAHAAVGEHHKHDDAWQTAFDSIESKYHEVFREYIEVTK